MKLKQYLTLGIGVAVGFGVSVVGISYASKNITQSVKLITSEQAKSIMLNKVPGANFIEFSYDGDDINPKYDGTLIKGDSEYEIDVDAKTGQITKCEKEVVAISNNSTNKNTINNANTNTQQNTTVTNNASSTTTTNNDVNSKTTTNSSSYIGSEKAKSIMLNKVPGATMKSFHFDNDSTPEYDGELIKDGYEYDISVDARTGAIREFSKESISGHTSTNNTNTNTNKPSTNNINTNTNKPSTNNTNTNTNKPSTNNTNANTNKPNTTPSSSNKPNTIISSSSYIGKAKAKSIMLSKVPGATIKSFKFDDDGEYEGELIKDGYEYDISVDARTGKINGFSKERIGGRDDRDDYDDDRYDRDDYDDDRYDN